MTIVVIGPNYWGKGATLAEAKRNFTKFGGCLSDGYLILTFSAETEFIGVDDIGRYHWRGDVPARREVKPRGQAARR